MELVLAIVGDRRYSDWHFFKKTVDDQLERYPATSIVAGDATGVDTMALNYALMKGIPIVVYCASQRSFDRLIRAGVDARLVSNWALEGAYAGHKRNTFVVSDAGMILLFDGGGPGSKNIFEQATRAGKEVEHLKIEIGSGTIVASHAIDSITRVLSSG